MTGWPAIPAPRRIGEVDHLKCNGLIRPFVLRLGERLPSIRIHRWVAGDPPQYQHAHPWAFLTLVLRGGYDDVGQGRPTDTVRAPAIRLRRRDWQHAVCDPLSGTLTIVVTGKRRGSWRYWMGDQEVNETTWNAREC